ncbi:sirohydrochlorin chelatase [Williamsia herbipolensis]|uniref:sirohydrochlorin chelatase n=1 Tax=Williamsia herbipolensis TaxID=1603258 RepID=UPI0005F7F475|nr:sirohydrochlorin chelatase [Williamsia herbipolensis]
MTDALVLAAHGSRDPRFAVTAREVTDAVGAALPGTDVHLGFLDLDEPSVAEVLAEVAGPHVVVVPLLFSAAFHTTVDLPAALDAERGRRPEVRFTQAPPLGSDPRLLTALADRLHAAGLAPDDGVVLCAVGSRDRDADAQFHAVAADLAERVACRGVEPLFATRLGPEARYLREAVDRLEATGARRIVVGPYFLSAGTLTDRVEKALADLTVGVAIAEPIGAHPGLIDTICDRYRTAATGNPGQSLS